MDASVAFTCVQIIGRLKDHQAESGRIWPHYHVADI